ncbi:unnamed protein product [Dovyalis caffra]|uniref:Uncharacterized protein n=1 Tax=Dovyalis caffra TaxID=77055 RepID=A0AAV1SI36_9ROSI|nr:unnamed protein product [Dovyalis caffra]
MGRVRGGSTGRGFGGAMVTESGVVLGEGRGLMWYVWRGGLDGLAYSIFSIYFPSQNYPVSDYKPLFTHKRQPISSDDWLDGAKVELLREKEKVTIGDGFERSGKLCLWRIGEAKLWVEVKSEEDEGHYSYNLKEATGYGFMI